MNDYRKLVPIEVERFDFSDGAPVALRERRHLFFNNFAYRQLLSELKRRGLSLPGAGQGEAPEGAAEALKNLSADDQAQMIEQVSVYVWAGLVTEARGRGETLSVEDVETWSFELTPEELAARLRAAIEAYAGAAENQQAVAADAQGN